MNGRRGHAGKTRLGRGVVISPRHAFIRPWIRAYFASGNAIPLIIIPGPPGDWQPGDMEYCKAAAAYSKGLVFDCSAEWEASRKLASRAVLKDRVGWYSKKNILCAVASRLAPKTWAWIDDDAEVTGRLDECFDHADKAPGFIYAQFYRPNDNDLCHPASLYRSKIDTGDKVCWNSMVFFHGKANKYLSNDLTKEFPVEDDEIVFGHLYQTDPAWREGFCDFSGFGWQCNCKRIAQIPSPWHGKLLHYTSHAHGGEVKHMWAGKADRLPKAPFETIDSHNVGVSEHGDAEAVDAVFVVGTGSEHANEELRYALRSLEQNCKFVRNVYICGECPPWIDTAHVRHLQWPDRFSHAKDANIIDKLRHACETRGVAKKILFCSDDQFQTKPCTWDDFAPRYLKAYLSDDKWYGNQGRIWHNRLRKTLEREKVRRIGAGLDVSTIYYYQPHIWMQIDRDEFIAYAKWCDYTRRDDTIIASGYFNFVNASGQPNFDHVFLSRGSSAEIPVARHVAYHDGSYRIAIEMLRRLFPGKSRFEASAPVAAFMPYLRHQPTVATIAADDQIKIGDASPATSKDMSEILNVMSRVRQEPVWHNMLGEVSLAEEMRLFGVRGWRIVWRDIIARWATATSRGAVAVPVIATRSPDAESIVMGYTNNPEAMRTIRYGVVGNVRQATDSRGRRVVHGKVGARANATKEEALARVRESLRGRRV